MSQRKDETREEWLARHRRQEAVYRAQHPERIRARKAAYYAANRDAILARIAANYASEPDRQKEYARYYRAANQFTVAGVTVNRRTDHPEEVALAETLKELKKAAATQRKGATNGR